MTEIPVAAGVDAVGPALEPTGPKPGRRMPLKTMIPALMAEIFRDGSIPPGRGRRAFLIKAIGEKLLALGHSFDANSIGKALDDAKEAWGQDNPGKRRV